jgi:RNA polymerase sigma-70 factor (ECF subfamily)
MRLADAHYAGRSMVLWSSMSHTPTTDPRYSQIEAHRPYLVRYALSQLRDRQLAEEAVQEALLAALEGIGGFDGRSTLRTWLTSILRFKVIDIQRRLVVERNRLEVDDESLAADHEAWLDDKFDETGHWRSPPQAWNDPEAALDQQRFWNAFEKCLAGLPATAGRVFFKREVLGEDTPVICRDEGITSSNCWVILHRARIALRDCLERSWFGREATGGR